MSTSSTSVDGTPGSDGLHRDLRAPHGRSYPSRKGDGQCHWLLRSRGSCCGEVVFCRHPILAYTSRVLLLYREYLNYHKRHSTKRRAGIGRLPRAFPAHIRRRFKLQQILCNFQAWTKITLLYGPFQRWKPQRNQTARVCPEQQYCWAVAVSSEHQCKVPTV